MANYVFGVDVGGTTVKLGLFDIDGNLQDKWEPPYCPDTRCTPLPDQDGHIPYPYPSPQDG